MKVILKVVLLLTSVTSVCAQEPDASLSNLPINMGQQGGPVEAGAVNNFSTDQMRDTDSDIPTARLSKIAGQQFVEVSANTRSAKDAQIYRVASPSVVLILTKEGLGSGSLIGKGGEVITDYHVVKGYANVAVVFKPAEEGVKPTKDDMKVGRVIKFDEVADLALVKVDAVPAGRSPLRLGDSSDIEVGADAHAIGHPTGEQWTYTNGVISQYRTGYEWTVENTKHKADIIQTQTPINPGNSGGPLISDSATLIGINTFKTEGEGLNFAVAVDEVKKFLVRKGNRSTSESIASQQSCEPRQVSSWRDKANDANVFGYDTKCSGKITAEYIVPDKKSEPIVFRVDRNGDSRADVAYFDFERDSKWDLSLWDENYDGNWTLVGYHPDGSLTPSSFESYDAFQRRRQAQR